MSEKIKTLSIEGDTYVIPGEDPYNPADVTYARDEGTDWNNFQTMTSNDAEYVPNEEISEARLNKILDRAQERRIDESILGAAFDKVA